MFNPSLYHMTAQQGCVRVANDRQNRKGEAGLLRAAQNGQVEIITQANHVCNLDQHEIFTHQVRTFTKRLKAAIVN